MGTHSQSFAIDVSSQSQRASQIARVPLYAFVGCEEISSGRLHGIEIRKKLDLAAREFEMTYFRQANLNRTFRIRNLLVAVDVRDADCPDLFEVEIDRPDGVGLELDRRGADGLDNAMEFRTFVRDDRVPVVGLLGILAILLPALVPVAAVPGAGCVRRIGVPGGVLRPGESLQDDRAPAVTGEGAGVGQELRGGGESCRKGQRAQEIELYSHGAGSFRGPQVTEINGHLAFISATYRGKDLLAAP